MIIIHGFIEIETQYRDYTDPYEIETISIQDKILSIRSIEKDTNINTLTINRECHGYRGLHNFQFLIDYFSKQPNVDFYMLSQCLKRYQEFLKEVKKSQINLLSLINQKIISKNNIVQAINDYEVYFFEQVKSHLSDDDFIVATFNALNLEIQEVEPRRTLFTQGLLSLFGIEINQEQEILHQMINLHNNLGKERVEAALNMLDYY
ncbi:hypothetical protein ABPG72_010582 [Tetrahymena utriculariae]